MMSEPSPVNAVKGLADRKQIGAGEGRKSVTQDMRLLVIPQRMIKNSAFLQGMGRFWCLFWGTRSLLMAC